MSNKMEVAVIEINVLRELIREVFQQEMEGFRSFSSKEAEYKDTDRLSISQAAEYLGVSNKTISNYRKNRKIPEPEYNLSGKPRWTVAQLKEALNIRKAKQKFPVS